MLFIKDIVILFISLVENHSIMNRSIERDDIKYPTQTPKLRTENSIGIARIIVPSILIIAACILYTWIRPRFCANTGVASVQEPLCTNHLDLTVGAVIGQGSFGVVFHAWFEGKPAAVKVMPCDRLGLWYNECEILAENKNHDNVITFLASEARSFEDQKGLCLITEYFQEGNLRSFLTKSVLDITQGLFLIRTLLNGIVFIHSTKNMKGESKYAVAHRDIKSVNVLLDETRGCVLADFGLATNLGSTVIKSQELVEDFQVK